MLSSQTTSYKIVNFKISTKSIFDLSKKKFDFFNNESIDTSSPSSYLIYEENENSNQLFKLKTKTLHQALCSPGNKIKVLYLQSALDIIYLHKAMVHKNCEVTTLCAHTNLGLEQSKIFANILKKNSTITTFKISSLLSFEDALQSHLHNLAPALNANNTLTELDICDRSSSFYRLETTKFLKALKNKDGLKIRISIEPFSIFDHDIVLDHLTKKDIPLQIKQIFRWDHTLYLSKHRYYGDCKLVNIFKFPELQLQALTIAHRSQDIKVDFSKEALCLFAAFLAENTSLVSVGLREFNMTHEALEALSSAIIQNKTLKTLMLDKCSMQKQDAEKLLIAIGKNTGLQDVLLHSDKNIGMDPDILADILRNNKNLFSCEIVGYVDSLPESIRDVMKNHNMLCWNIATQGELTYSFTRHEDSTQPTLSSKINSQAFYQLPHDGMHHLTYKYISVLSTKIRAATSYNEQCALYNKFLNIFPSKIQNFLLDLEQYLLELIPDHLNLLRVPALFLESAAHFSDSYKLPATRAALFQDGNPISSIISILQKENVPILEMLPRIISTLAGDEIVKSCTIYRYIVQSLLKTPEQQKSLDPDYVIFLPTEQLLMQKTLRLFEKTSETISSIFPHQTNEYAKILGENPEQTEAL